MRDILKAEKKVLAFKDRKMKNYLFLLMILISFCVLKQEGKGRFFTEDEFINELHQEVNADVLGRIKNDDSITSDDMVFSFYYVTNEVEKIDSLTKYLKQHEPEQQIMELNKIILTLILTV